MKSAKKQGLEAAEMLRVLARGMIAQFSTCPGDKCGICKHLAARAQAALKAADKAWQGRVPK